PGGGRPVPGGTGADRHMTEDLGGGAVRYEGDRPVAVGDLRLAPAALAAGPARHEGARPVAAGDLRLAQPTRMAATSAGFWGLYEVGDEVLVVHPAGAVRGPAGEGRPWLGA